MKVAYKYNADHSKAPGPFHAALIYKTTLCKSFFSVKLHISPLLKNKNRTEHKHYISFIQYRQISTMGLSRDES
jgi:hypothetical protein